MIRPIFRSIIISGLLVTTFNSMAQDVNYPKTKKENVSDNYFGNIITDPYRWLENDTSAATAQWVKKQNKITQNYLSNIPGRDEFKNRLTDLYNYQKKGIPEVAGKYLTYYKNDGLQNQPVLYILNQETGEEEILVDPNKLSTDGTVALQATAFSKNQKYFAYAVSASGSDWQEIYILDLKTKKLLSDKIAYVKFTGIEWDGDNGFYYSGYEKPQNDATKYSAKTEFQKVFYHQIGSSKDQLVYEDLEHPLRYVSPQLTENGKYLILNISEGTDGAEIKIKDLSKPNNPFITLIQGFKTNAAVVETLGDELVIITNENADNYKIIASTIKNGQIAETRELIPTMPYKLESAQIFGDKIYATYLEKACSKIVVYDAKGKKQNINLPQLEYATISGFHGKKNATTTYFSVTSYTTPTTIYKYDIEKNNFEPYFTPEVGFDPNQFITEQIDYPSKDGTLVSMFIVRKKEINLDGQRPTMLYGYGGFNISLTPSFSPSIIPLLERDGIYVVVNLRGGGEYGEEWHKQGMLHNKQNVFNDFIAAAEYLIQHNYTSYKHLAIRGGSNGGLLVGACMTQRPDLFAVAFPQVGVLDMLRYHKFTVGWGWAVEYGSSDNEEQFNYLIKYSPLHNIQPQTCYPATMVTTADHDDRVVPAHSFKFAATLQEAQGCDKPTLIRIDENAGHGAGKPISKVIEEYADIWAFMMNNIGK
jgi:prolyl oligopeptidase